MIVMIHIATDKMESRGSFVFFFLFETISPVAQADLDCVTKSRLALNSWKLFCLASQIRDWKNTSVIIFVFEPRSQAFQAGLELAV